MYSLNRFFTSFCKNKRSLYSLLFIFFLFIVAVFSPFLAGSKPIICLYDGKIYFPFLVYYNQNWESNLSKNQNPESGNINELIDIYRNSWCLWPLIREDPYRRTLDNEIPGRLANSTLVDGFISPSFQHPMGLTPMGVDVLCIMIHGAKTVFIVSFFPMILATVMGVVLGTIAGFSGGVIRVIINRLIEITTSVPTLILVLAFMAFIEKPQIWHIILVLSLTHWTKIARLVQSEVLKIKNYDYVSAAVSMNASPVYILVNHIIPNSLTPVWATTSFGIASMIFLENSLDFLGFSPYDQTASWGSLLYISRNHLNLWWLSFYPGIFILSVVMACNYIGEGFQESSNPLLRRP